MNPPTNPPMLDTHAHVAPDVTPAQVNALGNAHVFAVTRSIDEARLVARRKDTSLTWGLGVHPGRPDALDAYNAGTFTRALNYFTLVGEVGMDRRGDRTRQREVFDSILTACTNRTVLISIHSTGRAKDVLEALTEQPHPGAILHWFNGTPDEIDQAATLGCYFSVNAAMPAETIAHMPVERLLTETDFPSSRRKTQASKPGDVQAIERIIADIHQTDARRLARTNLEALRRAAGL
ncbi:TatD family hydrolase [Nocardioides sp. W7]|uniref:TatD family hydrolase n=1 Tax=Nocardioides sp. W7 TaxID=2931390 RepID=UPI001FD5BE20|nr:TatD family hydrolase [Nocardioides sp. W7]